MRALHADRISLERELADCALAQVHPMVRIWLGKAFEADLHLITAQQVALLTDDAVAGGYAEAMKVLALPPTAFRARIVEIDGTRVLARIDFPDTTGTNSFVEIFRATTPPGSITDATVFHRLAEAFAEFAPRRIQFYHPSHLLMAAPGASVDQHFLAGLAREMATRSPAPGLERIELTRATNLSCYPRYKAAYRQMHDERPALLGSVRIEDEESLAACLADGLLFEIVVDGVWAGIVAARDRVFGGVRGVYMIEIVLDASHRGQSLGPAVHQRLAAIVSTSKPAAVITGTIARANTPSLKTANRAGRVEIGAWYWLEL